ncbi:hypothetical protein C0991_004047 [Blastosporella zonata]|nr:hypothetical protein C0991_004047 [Blastosporella zonata]
MPMSSTRLYNARASMHSDPDFDTTGLISPPPEETLQIQRTSSNSTSKRKRTVPMQPQQSTPNPKPRKQSKRPSSVFHSPTQPNPNADFLPTRMRRTTPIPAYEPPPDVFTPPRIVILTPTPMPKSSKRKTPGKGKKRASTAELFIKTEPPFIDLSAPMPPSSPTDDPLLLSGFSSSPVPPRRLHRDAAVNTTPPRPSSSHFLPPSSSPIDPEAQAFQWPQASPTDSDTSMDIDAPHPIFSQPPAEWSDDDDDLYNTNPTPNPHLEPEIGQGEYTGRFLTLRVRTKLDPPSSATRDRMEEWGRPITPFPYSKKPIEKLDLLREEEGEDVHDVNMEHEEPGTPTPATPRARQADLDASLSSNEHPDVPEPTPLGAFDFDASFEDEQGPEAVSAPESLPLHEQDQDDELAPGFTPQTQLRSHEDNDDAQEQDHSTTTSPAIPMEQEEVNEQDQSTATPPAIPMEQEEVDEQDQSIIMEDSYERHEQEQSFEEEHASLKLEGEEECSFEQEEEHPSYDEEQSYDHLEEPEPEMDAMVMEDQQEHSHSFEEEHAIVPFTQEQNEHDGDEQEEEQEAENQEEPEEEDPDEREVREMSFSLDDDEEEGEKAAPFTFTTPVSVPFPSFAHAPDASNDAASLHEVEPAVEVGVEEEAKVETEAVAADDDYDDDSSEDEVDYGVVKITSADPRAAARAAAVLKQHDYDCYTKLAFRLSHPNKRHTLAASGISKPYTSTSSKEKRERQRRRQTLGGVLPNTDTVYIPGSPATTLPALLREAEASLSAIGSPFASHASAFGSTTPNKLSTPLGAGMYTPLPAHSRVSLVRNLFDPPQDQEGEREWTKDDWKLLDACFTDERLALGAAANSSFDIGSGHLGDEHGEGAMAPVDQVRASDVIARFVALMGGEVVRRALGERWNT